MGSSDSDDLFEVIGPDGSADPALDPGLPQGTLLAMLRAMRRIRAIDARMMMLQRQGRVSFYGECRGQEATPVAFAFATELTDWIFPALREGAIMLVRGFGLDSYLAQVYGNDLDELRGRQMPSHYASRSVAQVSWSSCIGTQVPHAVGAAWAAKLRGDRTVTVGFMGDGATSEADFHVAMNFAAVYRAPCVLCCQNNHWSISVPSDRQTASSTFAKKAVAYGMPGIRVNGNDVLALFRVASEAVERARSGGGPTFIEAFTYRMGAHSSSDDPSRYRDQRDVDEWARRDPVAVFERYLTAKGLWDAERGAALGAELDAEVLEAVRRVESHGPPAVLTMFDDVYAERPWHLEEQRQQIQNEDQRGEDG
ncbi:MAG: 3-methyl-2-oxobutanoate dehydrogenase [Deltaproteobacteria bacterium]|nr:3-methyl-2-oxobutanoate dehydrogenase [Deltaproteobacteria bacterium]